ncbi:hypothetical protein B566_EDAN013617 [Ephemera danica]|nr:hypothetical protein B566_EDAN013617 [Ephemera danica]
MNETHHLWIMSENKKTAKPFTTGNDAVPISNAESPGNIVYEGENDPDYKMDLECRGNAIILILDGDKTRRAMEDAETLETVVKDNWKLIGAKLRVESEHLDMLLKHNFMTTFANCVANNPEMDLVDLATTINRESSRNTERYSHYMSTLIRNFKFGSTGTHWSDDKDYQNKSEKLIKCIDINLIIKCEAENMLKKLDDIIADTIATEKMKNKARRLSEYIKDEQKDDSVVTVISHFRGLFDDQYKKYEELLAKQ